MSITFDKEQVKLWTEQASRTLDRARELCTEGQASLLSTTYRLTTHLPEKLQFAKLLVEALEHQQQSSKTIVDLTKHETQTSLDAFDTRINGRLRPAIQQLDNIVLQLQYTKIPSFLIEEASESEVQNRTSSDYSALGDFISVDALALLKKNISIYQANSAKVNELVRSSLKDVLLNPYNNSLFKQYKKVMKQYEDVIHVQLGVKMAPTGPVLDKNRTIDTLIKENTSLEQELVSILEMLTNHYDQCSKGLSLVKGTSKNSHVNFEVLQSDAQELPEVMKELTTVYNVILKNETRSNQFLDSNLLHVEAVIDQAKHLLESYASFKRNNITKYTILSLACNKEIFRCSIDTEDERHPIDVYTELVEQLSSHYTQFLDVYKHKYLTELHYEKYVYPRKFLKKLSDFLNSELYQIQGEERQRRKRWLDTYGDFIPREFKLPGEHNQPAVVQVVTEGLDEVDQVDLFQKQDGEMLLLKLISSTK